MNKPKCEHIIGIYYAYEDTDIVTLSRLQEEVERKRYLYPTNDSIYSISDYCDRQKDTNLEHFDFCPKCGQKIYWSAIKKIVMK